MTSKQILTGTVILLLVLLNGVITSSRAAAQEALNSYQQAFILITDQGEQNLYLAKPHSLEVELATFAIDGYFIQAAASPDGRWIALITGLEQQSRLELYNPGTGEVREVIPPLADYYFDQYTPVSWSNDGQYLAYTAARRNLHDYTYVYTISTDEHLEIAINGDYGSAVGLTWSPDSTMLTIETVTCEASRFVSCFTNIAVLNPSRFDPYSNAGGVALTGRLEGSGACDVNWSPDGRYLSFNFECNYARLYFHEIFVLDVELQTLTQLTSFTTPYPGVWTEIGYQNGYDSIWINETTLVSGVQTARGDGPFIPETMSARIMSYELPSASSQILMDAVFGRNWDINPVDDLLTFNALDLSVDQSGQFIQDEFPVLVAQYDNGQLNVLHTIPNGCQPEWSPDGEVLSYFIPSWTEGYEYYECSWPTDIAFLHDDAAESAVVTLPPYADFKPIGWVATPNYRPTSNAGADQIVQTASGTAAITLDGSVSSDSDGHIINYIWTEADNVIAAGATPQVSFPVGVHTLILTVMDDDGATAADEVTITVQAEASSATATSTPTRTNTPTPTPSATPTPTALITNVTAANGKAYTRDVLNVGSTVYIDRTYTYTALPPELVGRDYIRTAIEDRQLTTIDFLTFTLTADAEVYVLWDSRFVIPNWLRGWTNTGLTVTATDATGSLVRRVYRRSYPAGTVSLSGNGLSQGVMYNVTVVPTA
jgi:hypothetical protein